MVVITTKTGLIRSAVHGPVINRLIRSLDIFIRKKDEEKVKQR
jgi:hypothetical protein